MASCRLPRNNNRIYLLCSPRCLKTRVLTYLSLTQSPAALIQRVLLFSRPLYTRITVGSNKDSPIKYITPPIDLPSCQSKSQIFLQYPILLPSNQKCLPQRRSLQHLLPHLHHPSSHFPLSYNISFSHTYHIQTLSLSNTQPGISSPYFRPKACPTSYS